MSIYQLFLVATILTSRLLSPSHSQQTGAYPSVGSVATYRPVMADSVCGSDGPEQYCQYTTNTAVSSSLGLLPSCLNLTCDNTCPHSDSSPEEFRPSATGVLGTGVSTVKGRDGTENAAFQFQSSSIEVNSVPLLGEEGFTFAAWVNRESGNSRGTVVSKSSPDDDSIERNYVVSVEESRIIFDYLPDTLDLSSLPAASQRYRTIIIDGLSLPAGVWHHIAVTVYKEDAAVYVNGTVEGVEVLEGEMVDFNRTLLLGQISNGIGSFNGRMEDMYLYSQALTQREVRELYTGSLPFSYLNTECRCPPSHPVIDLDDETRCIQHDGGDLTNRGSSDRINPNAHPPGFVNDLRIDQDNGWISSPGDRHVNITLTLTNSLYELIFVNFQFGSPRFKAAVLETSRDGGLTFEPIQYYANDCMEYFNLPNDGQITEADSVNCITSESVQIPTYGAGVRARPLNPQIRPFDLNTSPELRHFILSSHLRVQLVDFFEESTSIEHLYYNILEITVAARCACNGHSSRCGTSINSVCECAHNTDGDTCDRCLPLYNDKPWRYGDTDNAYPCKICDCNGHASSCHYNASLDPFPDSYNLGGGGVCDNCQSNTVGQHCETCAYAYYRPSGVSANDSTPCLACDCDTRGTVNSEEDCVKSDNIPGQVVGQCQCKSNVIGLQCDECQEGFFFLSATNSQGCSSCNCNLDGTVMASNACHQTTGQCVCKENVMGLKCDQCVNGTTILTGLNDDGCSSCDCNDVGSLSSICDPVTGMCDCKPGVGGIRCDECMDGYYGLSEDGCLPCTCNEQGANSIVCDKDTGDCTCRPNIEGQICDTCSAGYYNLSDGCVECNCNSDGTLNGNTSCLQDSGQCFCKENVEGRICDTCYSGFTDLSASNPSGCEPCDCFENGTDLSGSICDPISSQCDCQSSAMGLRCDSCRSGFHSTPTGCAECGCHPIGSFSNECNTTSGECTCNEGVSGLHCDVCLEGFFNFPSCEPCNCSSAGTLAGEQCNAITGVCNCKMFVTEVTCDSCQSGYQQLDQSNPFGCSAAPDEQGPPSAMTGSTYIVLTWTMPEAPNGVINGYRLYRNGSSIANITEMMYNDTDLTPNSYYGYRLESYNVIGSTTSSEVVFKTLEGIPTGIDAPTIGDVNSTSVQVEWMEPNVTHGVISHYILLAAVQGESYEEVFRGNSLSYVVTNLRPFTNYSFSIQACTNGGCGFSTSSQIETAQAPPTFQPAPSVTANSSTMLFLQWDAPGEPNGIIVEYRIFQREVPLEDGTRIDSVDMEIRSLTVDGLRPFTTYQFRVESHTEVGGTTSEWSQGTTDEAGPSGLYPPEVTAVSSTSLNVTWREPQTPNGVITNYSIFDTTTSGDLDSLLTFSSSPAYLIVDGLDPFTEYGFVVEVCTAVGCNDSQVGTGQTGESVPIGQSSPSIGNITATSVELFWEPPFQPNGIISNYTIHRRRPSLIPAPAQNGIGVSFTGNGYATFSPSNPSSFENTLSLRFRTFDCCGILFYAINTAETDMFAVELRQGVPWLIYDAGTGPGVVKPEGDTQFDDGQWHTLVATQRGNTGTITIDNIHTGSGESEGMSTVVAYVTHYVGGLPLNTPLQTINADSNSPAQLLGKNFAGCLYNVVFNEDVLDFSPGFPGVGDPVRGCPIDLVPTMQLLGGGYFSLVDDTVTGNSFNISFRFRTTHMSGLLFFMSANSEARFSIEIRDSNIYIFLMDMERLLSSSSCDEEWHDIVIRQEGTQLSITLDENLTEAGTIADTQSEVSESRIYFGGIPSDSSDYSTARNVGLRTDVPFSGCIEFAETFIHADGQPVTGNIANSEFVNYDGCGSSVNTNSCEPPWHELEAQVDQSLTDTYLTPFSAYLYRVVATNSAGSAYGSWQVTATSQSVPEDVGSVVLQSSSSSSLTVTWSPSETPNGLIIGYSVIAMAVEGETGSSENLSITQPEQRLEATLSNLLPFTNYSVTLSASTVEGTGTGPAVILTTSESAPEDVQAAYVTVFGSRMLTLSWFPPLQPNGIVLQYTLFVNGIAQFSGMGTSTTVENLQPSNLYVFIVEACTSAGCTNSSESSNATLPDRPDGLAPPLVIPLTPTSLEITWEPPEDTNGMILSYALQLVTDGGNVTLFEGIGFSYQDRDLTPNTLYRYRVLATNAGGTTASDIAQNYTLEDAPDNINPPLATALNSTSITVTWQEPGMPNGVITEYILSRDGSVVFRGQGFSYTDTSLEPFTQYSYVVQACNSENCSASIPTIERTNEAVPEGIMPISITFFTSNSISFQVNEVDRPNGIVRYVVTITGEFDTGVNETREVFNDTSVGTADIEGLLPFREYQILLRVSNSAGTLSDMETQRTGPAAPEGLQPANIVLLDATTFYVSWSAPEEPNDDRLEYQLEISNNRDAPLILDQGMNTSDTVYNLRPFTNYSVSLTAYNSVGNTSATSVITTGETAPAGFDEPSVLEEGARFVVLSWEEPAQPNGVLVMYVVLQAGETIANLSSQMAYNVTGLLPYTNYTFLIKACTTAACVEGPPVVATTKEDVPEGVQAPNVINGPGQVLIYWRSPSHPNGEITEYTVERAQGGNEAYTEIHNQSSGLTLIFGDTGILPYTNYSYRIVAVNSAGSATGPSSIILTPEAAPEGVYPPSLSVISSTAIQVLFRPPQSPNGVIVSYTLNRQGPSTEVTITLDLPRSNNESLIYNDTMLFPFTNYTYSLIVCTSATDPCTTSEDVWIVTDEAAPNGLETPIVSTINESLISVLWSRPMEPNGVIESFILMQQSFGFYLPENLNTVPNCCEEYLNASEAVMSDDCKQVDRTDGTTLVYTVSNLTAYSHYRYCIIAMNSAGATFSPSSNTTRTLPAQMPIRGPNLTATTVNSTSIYLSWSTVDTSQLLGPFDGYVLYGGVEGETGTEVLFMGDEQEYTVVDLQASTEYTFMVSVSNGRGSTFGNIASARTEEGIPANLSAPIVQVISATEIQVTWSAPNQPNGVITLYTIFLDSVEYHNQSVPGTLTIAELKPYSVHTVRVEACTRFGCTLSPLEVITTLESSPAGFAAPVVDFLGPYSANISWMPPTMPNGVITSYQLFQREGMSGEPVHITSGLTFWHIVTDLRPFTLYVFEVYAINGGGNVSSMISNTTDEARPTFIDAPTVTVVSDTVIELSWSEPDELNGVLRGYNLFRNEDQALSMQTFTAFTDTNLDPFTEYTYRVEACTNAGCTESKNVSNTTLEALPQMVSAPIFSDVQARSIEITWEEPSQPNGIITQYILYQVIDEENSTILSDDLSRTASLEDLTPYTSYTFYIDTCNSVGCTLSQVSTVTTLEAPPEGVDAPILRDLSSNSININWRVPDFPNGIITNYTIRRRTNDSAPIPVFEGLAFSYSDTGLIPNTGYFYTVTATNSGGSRESGSSFILTVPDLAGGIFPPSVTVLGPESIRVTWSPPLFPNGEISHYILYMNDMAVFSGMGFEYSTQNLIPFTNYTFYYEVVNQAGRAGSESVTVTTDATEPEGFDPPTLVVLGSAAIRVEWQPPSQPNGIISEYRVRRRLFENPATEFLHFFTRDTSVLLFQNSGLEPNTRYEYRIEVFNQAGSTLSGFSSAQTNEDIPEGVTAPVILSSNTHARNVTAIWSAPSQPNGVITGYRLEHRLLLDPNTNLPGDIMIAVEVLAAVTSATAVGLFPVTTYEFRVAATNSAGDGFSSWEVVTTSEDVPEGITDVNVESRTSTSFILTWGTPDQPNGQIREFILLLDGEIEHQTLETMYEVTRLEPFTTYSLQLGACTSAGCAYGVVQFVTTDESPPTGLATPTVTTTSARVVQVTWEPPTLTNGIIILYEVIRQQDESISAVIFSTSNTATRQYEDTSVLPATTYSYSVAANNSVGRAVSEFKTLTTPEAAPEGITAPELTVVSSSSIGISWSEPSQPNGVISQYQLFRDGGGQLNVSVYSGLNRQFSDSNLAPFTSYSYILRTCTTGGCGFSLHSLAITLEALPEGFDDSSIQALPLTSTSIRVSWTPPMLPNGIILNYMVLVSDGLNVIEIIRSDFSTDVTNLQPYTQYSVIVDACNSIGCATGTVQVTTLEDIPQFIAAPTLQALNPTTVFVQWEQPARPNGIIISYTLRRDGLTIAEINTLRYNDTTVLPNREYSYTVQAFTSVGGSEHSLASSVQTPPDTPEDISPPTLTVLESDSILVEWEIPGRPNGEIQRYILSLNGTKVFQSTSVLTYTAQGLAPFTVYQFRVDACTTTCGNSSSVTARTGEATPIGQTPPSLSAPFQNTTVLVTWDLPSEPNGVIILCQIRRRLTPDGDFVLVYSDLETEFQDRGNDLRPATVYEYQVTCENSVGSATSDSSSVTTPDGPPEGVPTPIISGITSTTLTATAMPPSTPNGFLNLYVLYQNNTLVSQQVPSNQDSNITFTVDRLLPFTVYVYRIDVCTVGGCGSSNRVVIRTSEDVPQGFDVPPEGDALSARSILVTWSPPNQPNGIITSYTIWHRLACPQPEQPELTQPPCIEGPLVLVHFTVDTQLTVTGSLVLDPLPYSRYQFLIEARNSIGAINSSLSSSIETLTSAPEVKGALEFTANQTTGIVTLYWESTFRPNGPVLRYTLMRNGIALLSRPVTSIVLSNEPKAIDLSYVVMIETSVGTAATDPVTLRLQAESTTSSSDTPTVGTGDSSSDTPFYRVAAFIAGMVILAVCLVFISGAVFLCFIRPRGDPGYPTSPHSISTHLDTTPMIIHNPANIPMLHMESSPTKPDYTLNTTRQSRGTMAGSWSPGDPIWEDLPDTGEDSHLLVTPRKHKSYSPQREEKARLLEEEVLPDTHIAGYGSGTIQRQGPQYTTLAKEDFGTFRASQTTFADTKV